MNPQVKTQNIKVLWMALAVLTLVWVGSWAYKKAHEVGVPTIVRQPPGHIQAPAVAPAPDPVEYGTFMVTTGDIAECELRAGESIEFSPIENLAYDWFVNGVLHLHYPVYRPGQVSQQRSNIPYNHTTGYRLSPNQGRSEIKFAYVKYIGSTPPQNWYAKALLAGDSE